MRPSQRVFPATLAFVVLLLCPRFAAAQTFVSGTISTNTTWTLAQSPFVVSSPVRIPAGITLRIEPGVVVRFEQSTGVTIEGTLIARGTAQSKILFTSTEAQVTPGFWGQVNFSFGAVGALYDAGGNWIDGSVLEHVIIEGAGDPPTGYEAAIYIRDTRPLIESVTIRDSAGSGLQGYLSQPAPGTMKIRNSDFSGRSPNDGRIGIDLFYSGSAMLEGNRIENYGTGIYSYQFYPGAPTAGSFPGQLLVSRNRLTRNTDYGIVAWSSWLQVRYVENVITGNGVGALLSHQFGLHAVEIARNIVQSNRERGMYVTNRGSTTGNGSLSITGNVFAENIGSDAGGTYTGDSGGLHAEFDGSATITQNVFASNVDAGIGGADIRVSTGSLEFSRNLVTGNLGAGASGVDINSDGASTVTLSSNTFTQNAAMSKPPVVGRPAAVRIYSFHERTGSFTLRGNNIFGNTTGLSNNRYSLFIDSIGIPTADATGNWWGTTDTAVIDSLVAYGPSEAGTNRTLVVSTSPLTGINTDAPVSPPTGLVVTRNANTASLAWNPNPEIDVAGYRVWYGMPGDATYAGTGAAQGASPIDVGAATSFQLTGLPPGAVVTVTAYDTQRDGVNDLTDGHESWYASLPPSPLVLTSLTADRTAPLPAQNGFVTFTARATGGREPYRYLWQVWNGSQWSTGYWYTDDTFRWYIDTSNPNYRIRVSVQSFTNLTDGADNAGSIGILDFPIDAPTPMTAASIYADSASPQPTGTFLFFTAQGTGGSTSANYKWRLSTDGGVTYTTVQDWGWSPYFSWTPTTPVADARINVWVRSYGTAADAPQAQATISYVVTAPLALTSITPSVSAPQSTGTTITFTAAASGGVAPYQYKWWVYDGSQWTAAQNWSTSATFAWTPTIASSASRIGVWVRNAGNTADTYANANSNGSIPYPITAAAGALTVTGITSSLSSPQMATTAITFAAAATGGTPPVQYKWRLSMNGGTTYSTLQEWSTSPTLIWTPANPIADARINVWARSSGVTADAPQSQATVPYQISTYVGPLTLASITAGTPSPQTAGTTIVVGANSTGGTTPHQYKWWLHNGSSWSVVRDWNYSTTFAWTPSAPGSYRVAVWVRNGGSTADIYDNANANGSIEYVIAPPVTPLAITGLTSSVPSPQVRGTSITFTTASTGGTTPHQYKWRVSTDGGSTFTTTQDWSTNASYIWTPGTAIADARISVWVRNSGVTADAPQAQSAIAYTITNPPAAPLALTSIVPDVPSPQSAGTTISFTANASGGTAPYQYKWWLFDGTWTAVSNWSTSSTFSWTPSAPSTAYRIAVWVRNAGNTNDIYENANSNGSIGFAITAGAAPLSIGSLTSNVPSPQATGTSVTFSATASGGTAPYQFKWRVSTDGGASFITAQDWSSSSTFTWTPSSAVASAQITVWARNGGNTVDAPQAQATIAYVITTPPAGPLVLNSITPSVAAPQPAGTSVTFTANASGGTAPYQYKWWVFDGAWTVVSNWSTGSTFTWTPSTPSGAYRIAVWVRNAGNSNDSYENASSNGSIGYAITSAPAGWPTLAPLSSNMPSPQPQGTAITFTASASAGLAPYQYKWLISTNGGTNFATVQDWSTSSTFTWTPPAPIADARILVWARNNGVTTDTNQSQASLSYVITAPSAGPLVLNSITPSVAAPQTTGTTITFTANASGGIAPHQYKWWVFDGAWRVVSNWSTSSTFAWTPSAASTAYRVAVWVRNAGNTTDAYENAQSNGSIGYVITAAGAPLTLSSLTANVSSPQVTGTAVTFSAAAGGGTAPYQFKWRISTDGGTSFATVQDWSTTSTFTWTPGAPIGDARITVWARNNGVTSDTAQAQATMAYVITSPSAGPLVLNSIVPNLSSPRAVGTTVTFTANASGGTGPYQYKWWILDGSWRVVRDWNTDNTFTWTPASASSAYRVAVWVRNAGSSQDAYDNANSNASIAFVVVP